MNIHMDYLTHVIKLCDPESKEKIALVHHYYCQVSQNVVLTDSGKLDLDAVVKIICAMLLKEPVVCTRKQLDVNNNDNGNNSSEATGESSSNEHSDLDCIVDPFSLIFDL